MEKENKVLKNAWKALCILLFVLLIVWFFPFITKGIDVQDTCSYLTKYRYIFDRDVRVNELFYLFGELVGGIIYHLAPSHQALVLNGASWLCYTATALLIVRLLKDYLELPWLLGAALTGSFFGITWVHCLNWNAVSMLVQTIALMILLKGLKEEKVSYLFISGLLLAVNTFVRLPNILQLGLVCVVFWHYMLKGRKIKETLQKCFIFAGGAVAGAVLSLAAAVSILGLDKVMDDILMLTAVGGGDDSSHGIVRIVSLFYRGMLRGAGNWLVYGLILVVLACVWMGIRCAGTGGGKKASPAILPAAIVLAACIGVYAGILADFIDVHVFTAFGGIVLGGAGALYFAKKDLIFSDICAAAVILEGVLTIGTDTGSAYYRVYMGLPLAIILAVLLRFAKELKAIEGSSYKTLTQLKRRQWRTIWTAPFGMLLVESAAAFSLLYALTAGGHYAATFVYHDSDNEYLVEEVKAEVFAGLKTSSERAELLNRLEDLLEPYHDYKLLQLGSFNAGCVITDMKPFFDSSWPDLEYLTMDRFNSQLKEGLENKEYPVIVMGDMEQDMSGFWNMEKYEIVKALGESELYETLYEDKWYVIYVPKE